MAQYDYDYGTPGIRPDVASGQRDWLYAASASPNNSPPVYLPGGRVIDGTLARDLGNTPDTTVLRPGLPMGRVTTSGKYANSIIGASSAATTSGGTTVTTSAAVAAEVVRRLGASGTFIIVGPPTASGTVATETITYTSVNTSTGAITVSATSHAYVSGSLILPTDGSQIILGGLDQWLVVTNQSGTAQDTAMRKFCVSGFAKTSQIIGVPTDLSLIAWLKTQFNNPAVGPGPFHFDDNF